MNTTNGGSAFPTPDCSAWDGPARSPGMQLRDWFAGQALTGILAAEADAEGLGVPAPVTGKTAAVFAKMAYTLADAMLAERITVKAAEPPEAREKE